MSETESFPPPRDILISQIASLLKTAKESFESEIFVGLGVEFKKQLLANGYHDNWQTATKDDQMYIRNYVSFHRLVGSTIDAEQPPAFLDFPEPHSAISFLRSKIA